MAVLNPAFFLRHPIYMHIFFVFNSGVVFSTPIRGINFHLSLDSTVRRMSRGPHEFLISTFVCDRQRLFKAFLQTDGTKGSTLTEYRVRGEMTAPNNCTGGTER